MCICVFAHLCGPCANKATEKKQGEIGRIYTHSDFDIPMYTPIISPFFLSPCFSTIGITQRTGQSLLVYTHFHLCIM